MTEEAEALGAQIGAAKLSVDLTRPLKVAQRVSFEAPQVEPAVALRIATFRRALAATSLQWAAKVKWVSKTTPRILGRRSRGMFVPQTETVGWRFD